MRPGRPGPNPPVGFGAADRPRQAVTTAAPGRGQLRYGSCFLLLATATALVGCQGGAANGTRSIGPLVSRNPVSLTVAEEDSRSSLFLLSGPSRIAVGDDPAEAVSGGFKKPERAVTVTRLPVGLDDAFRFSGWEGSDRTLGLVSRNRNVLLAVDTRERVSQEVRDRAVGSYSSRFGKPETVSQARVSYWFWEDGNVRLMVCSALDARGDLSLTSALGVAALMNNYRMSKETAEKDAAQAQSMFDKKPQSGTAKGG